MGVEKFYGELMLEPMCLRPWEIAEMTDEQLLMPLAAAARRQRQMDGVESQPFDPEGQDTEEQYHHMRRLGLTLGYSPEQITRQWNELHPEHPMPLHPHSPRQQPIPTRVGQIDPSKPGKRSLFATKAGE